METVAGMAIAAIPARTAKPGARTMPETTAAVPLRANFAG
jgi:hypothetical protein